MHLSDYMAAHGLDDRQVAEEIGVDRATVSRIRRKKARPDWATIQRIREFTGSQVTANDFEQIEGAVA